ncbi:PA0069 family radical SAM protein [Neolewinella aurantiaca]|uniref:PA0069 family radical SAM protein n=1 Tax=Neolewinella aurantiaca TaxID=2602767 RepID=A0A5C7FID1_9BACT|nr:PA0069 family radical SAM protein [Neolewinella aurantiaca]TXF90286.1 PA0069 family radical SAM protein [Neolewinella aurantiaca]
MLQQKQAIGGRGAQLNPANPYHNLRYDEFPDPDAALRTEYIPTHPKTILNKVTSPDLGFGYGLNCYQGCEHGCVYCFARTTHTYWGYSAGLDFETKILYKEEAPAVLRTSLLKKNYDPLPIMMSGNTDSYQPAEKKFGLTRRCLEVLSELDHPVGLITKNSLIVRDLDLLAPMAERGLVHACLSITTLDEDVRRILEPRTATIDQRFRAVSALAGAGIPVAVNIAPVIPGLTDHEILGIAKRAKEAGARRIGYSVVRLNDQVADVFTDWAHRTLPDRADRILNRIRDCRGGDLGEKRFGVRHRGEGEIAGMIKQQFELAKRKFFPGEPDWPDYNFELFSARKKPQLSLF